MLLIQADRDALLKPLATVTGIVERRHTLPILSNVLISKQAGELSFLATDLEIQISTAHSDTEGGDFQLTISAKKFQDILRAITDGTKVSLEQDDNRLTVKAGKSRFNLQTLPAQDFPKLAIDTNVRSRFTVGQRQLKALISRVQYAMAHQDIRYYLNGLLMQTEGNELRLVATDGHRLGFISGAITQNMERHEVILPRKTILELYKLLADIDDEVDIEIAQNQVKFAFGNIVIHSKVVDGKFPDYNRVIPVGNEKLIPLNRQQLLGSLQRAAILSNEKFRGVRLVLSDGILKIICNNSEQEEATEELEIAYRGDPLDIGFNIGYLLDVLTNLEHENVVFAFGDHATSSTLVTVPEEANFKYVVMPMRI
ncbi:DNA polymerase III subunit beta [Chitinimonas sp. BJYL2]|uniref:DNA polymerase III subunit beta n=1 Tax=Chitinimonas sp. BJYL2 TaxID=2976696 RepID=UPI0022B2B598|nr:DNA polymerase III subunit beta [Chitinimonas sp. BJYL2]